MKGKPKRNAIIAIAAAAIFVAGTVAAVMSSGFGAPAKNNDFEALVNKLSTPTIANAPALGSADAEITIVEFGDYQCTYCARFHKETRDQVMTNFVDTGKVRFLFKDYPINDNILKPTGASSLAAEASYCAADQGKYWEYHDEVYDNWKAEGVVWVTEDSLKEFAANVNISDMDQFSNCLDSQKYSGVVGDNYNFARSLGLNSTPSFIILAEGKEPTLIPGAAPYPTFEKILNDLQAS